MAETDWHPVGHRAELTEPDAYLRRPLPSGRVVVAWVVRDGLLVFDGICPHRGAMIPDDDQGVASLRCPFHGLREAPIVAGARRYQSEWRGDILFVLDAEPEVRVKVGYGG